MCIAETLAGLKPSFAFFLDLSADSQILSMGRDWINMENDRIICTLRTLKCAWIHKRPQPECGSNVSGGPSSLSVHCTHLSSWFTETYFRTRFKWRPAMQIVLVLFAYVRFKDIWTNANQLISARLLTEESTHIQMSGEQCILGASWACTPALESSRMHVGDCLAGLWIH